MTPLRSRSSFSDWVTTFIPSATGVVQEEGVPLRPSTWITHKRHEPNAFRRSVEQSFGISIPTIDAARMMDVSAGTVIDFPSISRLTCWALLLAGVPKSCSWIIVIVDSPLQ